MAVKKKKPFSFEEWSNEHHGISKEQEEEDKKKWQAYLASHKSKDIAPIGGNKDSWFKSGGFSDGVDGVGDFFGDLGQTVAGTVGDLGLGILKGAGRLVEGVADLGTYGVAGVADRIGQDDFAAKAKKAAQYSVVDDWAPIKTATDFVDRYSVLGDKADMVSEGLGQVGGIILTGGLGAAAGLGAGGIAALTTGVTGLSSMGTGMGSAYESGASDKDAVLYGLGAGAIEAGTELLFGGLGKGVKALGVSRGIGGLDDMFAKKLSSTITRAISNETVRKAAGNTIEAAVKAGGEGAEEVLSGLGSAVMKKLTYEDDESLGKLIEDENLLEQFVVGAITSSIAQGADFVKSTSSGRDLVTGYTDNEQAVIDKVVEKRIAEREKDGTKLTTKEIGAMEEQVREDMEHGQLDIDTIEEVLGGDDYTAYRDTVTSEDELKAEYEELASIKKSELTTKQEDRLAELKSMNLGDTTKRDGLRKKLDEAVRPQLEGSRLAETYRERERRGKAFEADLTKYKGRQRAAVERAVNSGVLNNTYRSHELVDVLSKIEAEKGISFDYTNNAKLKESIFAVEGKTVNGYANKKTGTVTLNVQSPKAWQSVVGHEITHVLEGTESYGALQQAVYAYANIRGELETRRTALTELYSELGADVESELTADLVGDYLFTDKAFIDHLTGNRTLFQKVYDEIKYLWKVATGKERYSMERLVHEFDRAWKEISSDSFKGKTDEFEFVNDPEAKEYSDDAVQYSIRKEEPPKETGIAYKVFYVKDGKLYPPMVANPGGADTPIGVWLNADVGKEAPPSKTGRAQVKAGGKGTQGGSGSLAFRPGWHLGDLPRASQFDRLNPETGKKELFPENFVWAEVEYAKDVDYQEEAMSYGYTENGKFRHAYAGLPRLPENGYYRYRTNPKPDTVPWVITGAMKVNRLLSDAEVNEILEANGVPAVHRQGGDVGLEKFGFGEEGKVQYSLSTENDAGYMSAVENGDTETAQAMVDEAAKNAGYSIKAYHGTGYDFTVFDKSKQGDNYKDWGRLGKGFYFAPTAREAETWAELSRGGKNKVMPVYLKSENMLDSFEALPDNLKDTIPADWDSLTRRLAEKYAYNYIEYMQEFGHDVQAILKEKGYDGINGHVEYVLYDPEQIKSADPVTYNDKGEVIPLSERFNVKQEDIRYSLSDSDGNPLTEEQREYFKDSKVRDENGNLKVMYHGTPSGEFTVFRDGTYFTEHKWYADVYQNPGASSINSRKTVTNPKTYEVYLDIKKPFDISDPEARDIYINEYIKGGNATGINPYLSDAEYAKIQTIDWTEGEDLREFLMDNEYDYDGLVLDEGAVGGYGDEVKSRGTSYVIFSPEQVKEVGNKAPTDDPDIRFSLSPEMDAEYMSAVERGDTDTAQRMVDEAAKNAGYSIKAYHGTTADFFTFDKERVGKGNDQYGAGFYFASDKEASEHYGGRVIDVALKMEKPFVISSTNLLDSGITFTEEQAYEIIKRHPLIYDPEESPLGDYYDSYWEDGAEDWMIEDLAMQYTELGYLDSDLFRHYPNELHEAVRAVTGHDGIVVNLRNGEKFYVAWFDNQMKNVDPVTYDDNGNVIPVSERFKDTNNDIRYSVSGEGEKYAPVGSYSTPLRDLALEEAAPVVGNTPTATGNTPTAGTGEVFPEDYAPMTEADANSLQRDYFAGISDADVPPEMPEPYYGEGTEAEAASVQTIEQRTAEKIRAVQREITTNNDLRRESASHYDSRIAGLRERYDSKKNKDTKEARGILQSISRYERLKASADAEFAKRISDLEERVKKMRDPKYSRAMQKKTKMEADADWAAELLGDTSTWKDKKIGLQYATNTERRNLRDIVKDASGKADIARADAIDDALGGQYNREEAAKKRELAKVRQKYADMKITRAEDAYIQMLGELRHNPDTTLSEEVVQKYYEKHKGKIDKAKVDKVIELARQDYDELINRVNAELKRQGMREIPYRQGYFPHFTEPKQNFLQKLLNWKVQNDEIPTSIAGLTETFRPTRSWQSFDKTRYSDVTDYSFLKGFDSYSDGALDWIYHMDTLQKRRAVENHIRYTHSDEGIQARIKEVYAAEDIDATEAQTRIEGILKEANNPLHNFVQDFTTHTNILAGKKNTFDRGMEQGLNRSIYSVMTNVQNRLSANMVLANVRSALTNFIPITQSWAQVSPTRSLQAVKDTIANSIRDDGTVEKSVFLTNRLREADKLYQTNWDKILDKAGILFEIVDNFSSQVIWRSKYRQNLARGMHEAEAVQNADQFAENVMAGRSKGNEPTLFNAKNPLVKAFTGFQLEVSNQYGYFFKDVPNDLKAESKHWAFNLAKGYTTAFLGAYVYNALLEKVTGSEAALDPIGIIEELLRDLGMFGEDDEKEPKEAFENLRENVLEQVPFVGGYLGGGRFPISNALPVQELVTGKDRYGNEIDRGETFFEALPYTLLPFGYGQIKKTAQGLGMFSDEHPVSGSYTDSGKLRFPVEDTPANRVQAAVFGQYASRNAREYFDNGWAPLAEKQIQEFVDVDVPIREYREIREGLSGLSKLEEKLDYISGLDLPVDKKNILANNVTDRKEPIDMTNYEDFSGLEEFDFASKNPEKYAFLQDGGISYAEYTASEDSKEAYNWAYKNPEGYAVSKAVTGDVVEYRRYAGELNDITADKDSDGKSISGSRKEKVIQYINGLDLDYYAKVILLKKEYPSEDMYNADIVEYLNGREDISYEDMVTILTELGFRVTEDGQIYAD